MKGIKKILTNTIVASIITIIITTMALAGTVITVKVPKAYLRQSPTTKAKVIYSVKKGTNFAVLKTVKGWYQVRYKNKIYWISSGQVAVRKPAPKPAPKPVPNNGYKLPPKENADINTPVNSPHKVELEVFIRVYKDLEPQYKDLESVLLSKFDKTTVDEVMNYVKQKKDRDGYLPVKNIKAKGKTINIFSPEGDLGIQILVYSYEL